MTSNAAQRLLQRARAAGLRVWYDGTQLRYRATAGAVEPDVLVALRRHDRQELIRALSGSNSSIAPFSKYGKCPDRPMPLSDGQRRLLRLESEAAGNPAFVTPFVHSAVSVHGVVDEELLQAAVRAVTARHSVLQTRFHRHGVQVMQAVERSMSAHVTYHDLAALSEAERNLRLREVTQTFLYSNIDLFEMVPFRVSVIRLSTVEHIVVLKTPYIISDPWSARLLQEDFVDALSSLLEGRDPAAGGEDPQFREYVAWKHGESAAMNSKNLSFWREHLAGARGLDVFGGRPRAVEGKSMLGKRTQVTVGRDAVAAVDTMRQRDGITPFNLYFAGFLLAVAQSTGERDLTVGVLGARGMPEFQRMVGFCANYAPFRVRLGDLQTCDALLAEIRRHVNEAQEYYYPHIEDLDALLDLPRPFCQVQFHFNVSGEGGVRPWEGIEACGVHLRRYPLSLKRQSLYEDLVMSITEVPDGLDAYLLHDQTIFDNAAARRFSATYAALLGCMVNRRGVSVETALSNCQR